MLLLLQLYILKINSSVISIWIMNINILRYSLLGIAGGQEVDYAFVNFIICPLTMIAKNLLLCRH